MANFNRKSYYSPVSDRNVTLNHEGEKVHKLNALETLFSRVLASFFGEKTYYEDRTAEDDYKKLIDLINSIPYEDREYALKIALLGRRHNMIEYPLAILSVAFNLDQYKGDNFLDDTGKSKFHKYVPQIVLRAKDITELLSMQIANYGFTPIKKGKKTHRERPLPAIMRKTLTDVLESFDEYKLSKGLGVNKAVGEVVHVNKAVVTLADVIKLLHPKPKNKKMESVYRQIIENRLNFGAGKKTFQSVNVAVGKKEVTKEALAETVKEETLFSIVKNLESMRRKEVLTREVAEKITKRLTSPLEIKKSKMLPFRFYSAYKALNGNDYSTRIIKDALVKAIDLSVENMPKLEGHNCILIDYSGSMEKYLSEYSSVRALDIAVLLGAIAAKLGVADVFVFSDECKRVEVSQHSTIVDIMAKIHGTVKCGGTNLYSALVGIEKYAEKNNIKYDNFILLSDNDCYGYNKKSNQIHFATYSYLASTWNKSADEHINILMKKRIFKKVWINNLLGNDFTVITTEDCRKNIIPSFSEKFVEIINVYNAIGGTTDIRKVIDKLLDEK